MNVRSLTIAFLLLQACSRRDDGPPELRFRKGGGGRATAWKDLEPQFTLALAAAPKTRPELAAVVEQWLGPSEPGALKACESLVVWAGSPKPIDGDVFAWLLEQNSDGFRRYLVVDLRNPAKPGIHEACSTGPPSKPNDPHDRISDAEKAVAREIDAIPINLGGGSEDGTYKAGFRIWIQDGQGSAEILRKARTLTTLVAVDLEGKQVTDDWLAPLEGHGYVGSITLRSTSVTDQGLAFLRRSTGLKWLTLDHCAVTPAAVRALKAALPKCEVTVKP